MGTPQIGCKTLGVEECIRLPNPAAKTIAEFKLLT
jgi:hypothetical protein